MKGKLFVIDSGSDGSGKATQSEMLYNRLLVEGYPVRKVDFPNYKSDSSALVKMYLKGMFGQDAESVNPYAASLFYTVDRCASYLSEWKDFYENGGIVIADRYTTSNMIHQAVKITDETEREKYLNWLLDLEFEKCTLPKPDQVFFLDVPIPFSLQLIRERQSKMDQSNTKDIHESNYDYLQKCYQHACHLAERFGWIRIPCVNGNQMRPIEEINEEIYQRVKKIITI